MLAPLIRSAPRLLGVLAVCILVWPQPAQAGDCEDPEEMCTSLYYLTTAPRKLSRAQRKMNRRWTYWARQVVNKQTKRRKLPKGQYWEVLPFTRAYRYKSFEKALAAGEVGAEFVWLDAKRVKVTLRTGTEAPQSAVFTRQGKRFVEDLAANKQPAAAGAKAAQKTVRSWLKNHLLKVTKRISKRWCKDVC